MRQTPRFTNHAEVLLQFEGRDDLRPMWMNDISKGGLFVETESPPPLRSRVQVSLTTPEGSLALSAEVVHIVDEAIAQSMGAKPGVGLQFIDLDPHKSEAVQRYLDGLSSSPSQGPDPAAQAEQAKQTFRAVVQFLKAFDQEDLYGALSLTPAASSAEIKERAQALHAQVETASPALQPAQRARAARMQNLLKRVSALLLDPGRRFGYDVRHKTLDTEARLNTSTPKELEALHEAWCSHHGSAALDAQRLAHEAHRAQSVLDYEAAIKFGLRSLEHAPFNEDLRRAIAEWRRRLRARMGQA